MSLSSMGLLCRVAMFAVLSHVYGPQLVKLCGGKADIDFDQPDSWAGRQRIRGTIYAGDTFIVINSKLLVFYSCHLLVGFNCFRCYYCCFCYCFLSFCTCLPSPPAGVATVYKLYGFQSAATIDTRVTPALQSTCVLLCKHYKQEILKKIF